MEQPEIAQKAPYVIEEKPNIYRWCSCGKSSKQPYCDGSHKGTEFRPVAVEITEEKKVAWCGCKQSSKGAFCDGTHKKL